MLHSIVSKSAAINRKGLARVFQPLSLRACALIAVLCLCSQVTEAASIDFNSDNELTNNFVQNSDFGGPTPFYQQSPSGGITGGSVTGYSGQNYLATAVYKTSAPFDVGDTISLSMDFYYDAEFTPLAPGANAVRSFRLGLLASENGSFETFGSPSLYIGGVYGFDNDQMLLSVVSDSSHLATGGLAGYMTLQPDHWLQLDAKFTNVGSGDFTMSSSLYDLGSSGLASPQLLGFYFANGVGDPSLTAGSETFSNPDMTSPAYVGFSVLADGGISRADNLTVPGIAVPEPSTWAIMLLGFAGLGFVSYRRTQRAEASGGTRLARQPPPPGPGALGPDRRHAARDSPTWWRNARAFS
jgi:hypothetical protein